MNRAASTLVLFDIDGTLIQTAGAGVRGMTTAFRRLYRIDDALRDVPISGRTDLAITTDGFLRAGIKPGRGAARELQAQYFEQLPMELARPTREPFGVLPGVAALLDALDASPHVVVGLLTGNFVEGARIKLGHFGLWERFAFGAFGDEHLKRRDLTPVAVARAQAAGFAITRVIVVGDTPLDVDCALAHGAEAVAVATGNYSAEELTAAGAHVVVKTLADAALNAVWRG